MKTKNLYQEAVKDIPMDIRKATALSFSISDKIHLILKKEKMTQKEFARRMGKTEAEVSVWLSGQHNFTLRTLAKISAVLGEDIVCVPLK